MNSPPVRPCSTHNRSSVPTNVEPNPLQEDAYEAEASALRNSDPFTGAEYFMYEDTREPQDDWEYEEYMEELYEQQEERWQARERSFGEDEW